MTTTTTTTNRPSFELFYIEERPADRHLAAVMGKTVHENSVDRIWHKAGVAFNTPKGNANIYIGERGDPARKRYLLTFSSSLQKAKENREANRIPVGDVFEPDASGNFDFDAPAGVVFLNRDDSYTILIGDKGDLEQLRYQMRPAKAFMGPKPAATAAQSTEAKAPESTPEPTAAAAKPARSTIRRSKPQAQAAA